MNPKDMTNKCLVADFAEAWNPGPSAGDNFGSYYGLRAELLRRLDEADELRKENEELRKDKEKLLKDYAELRVNSALLVACDDVLEALELDGAAESKPQ